MSVKDFMSENGPTILSVASCAGVIGTGFAAMELGRELEKKKHDGSSKKRLIFKTCCTVGSGLLTIGGILLSNKFSKDKLEMTRKELAETTAALSGVVKLFHDYRKRIDPEKDKEIMEEFALKECHDSENVELKYEYDYCGNVLQIWKDQYICKLSKGRYTCYVASEADILAASNYVINKFCNEGIADFGMFYDCLRLRGVDIPEFPGEHDITWEQTNERWDYYGRGGLDFSYTRELTKEEKPTNYLYFDDDDDEIRNFDSKLSNWADSIAR